MLDKNKILQRKFTVILIQGGRNPFWCSLNTAIISCPEMWNCAIFATVENAENKCWLFCGGGLLQLQPEL